VTALKPSVAVALLIFVSCALLLGQTASRPVQLTTFHIEGTIGSPWDALPAGILVPRNWGAPHDNEEAGKENIEDKKGYVPLPRTEVTFQGERITRTVTVDDKGFYQTDLPIGFYKMIVRGPTVGPQALKQYVRQFRVKSPTSVVLNGTLYKARLTCDVLVGGDTEEQKMEEWKNICGAEDSFPIPSKDGSPFQIYIQYPHRQISDRGYTYISDKIAEPDVPVFVTYNLFSLEANTVFYDVKNRTIAASGNVVVADGSGKTRHAESLGFRVQDGQAIPLQ
jgi:hypothetical protein